MCARFLQSFVFILCVLGLMCASVAVAQIVPPQCRCGDADGDETIGRGDVLEIRSFLAGLISDVAAPDKCPISTGGGCDLTSLVALRRALARRTPELEQTCPAALNPSCPLPAVPLDIVCPAAPLPPAPFPSICEVNSVGTTGIRLRGTVLAADGILRGGEVLVDGSGEIICTDCDCSTAPGASDASVVTCGEGVISPGLINPLARASFADDVPLPDSGIDYDYRNEWRMSLNGKPQISSSPTASVDAQRALELRHLMSGTTAMSRGTIAGLTRDLDDVSGVGLKPAKTSTFPLGNSAGPDLVGSCAYPSPVQPNQIMFDPGFAFDVALGIAPEARNEFICLSQSPNDVLSIPTTRPSPTGLGAIDGTAYLPLRAGGSVPHLTLRSDSFLYGNVASLSALRAGGVPFALATDWPITGSLSMLRELACADTLNQAHFGSVLTDRDLWLAATANAALATTTESRIGTLEPGRLGDIVVFDARVLSDYRAVIGATSQDVALVLRGGEPLFGEATLIASLGDPACEPIIVCGEFRRVCVAPEYADGTTLSDLEIATANPLADCGVLPPVCELVRAEYPDGITAGDLDGDGVPNANDLCPDIFDPIRSADGGVQSDVDGDGQGDACDPCPVDAIDDCDLIFVADLDHDGELNETDNCPGVWNPGQVDLDANAIGDACEPLPPGQFPISVIRNSSDPNFPGFGNVVLLSDVYVTEVLPDGSLFVQSDELLPWTGIYLFDPTASSAVRGNRVDILGTLIDFFGTIELTNAIVTVTDPGTVLPFGPLSVPPNEIATGGVSVSELQSMLLQVGPVSVTNANPDAPDDFDQFEVSGGLRIDDRAFPSLDNQVPIGTPFDAIVGILDLVQNENHLLPRDANDLSTTAPREIVSLTPGSATIAPLATLGMQVTLTLPAPAGGEFVTLSSVPVGLGTFPPSVTVPETAFSAPFDFTAGPFVGQATLTASLGASSQPSAITIEAPTPGALVINEVDYDQPGPDDNEFIEIFNESLISVDLSSLQISLVNGSTETEYATISLASAGTLAPGDYLVIGSATVIAGVPAGVSTILLPSSIQNGAPDGLALVDSNVETVFDALSYEGSISNAVLVGFGFPVDLVEGTAATAEDSNSVVGSLVRLPNGTDTDDADSDWSFSTTPTPGEPNF